MSTCTAMTIRVAAREQLGQDFTLRSTWIGRLYDVHRAETARLRSCLHSCIRVAEFKYGLFVQCGGVHGGQHSDEHDWQLKELILFAVDESVPTLERLGTASKGDGDLVGVDVGVVVLALLLDGFAEVAHEVGTCDSRSLDWNFDAFTFLRVAHDTHFVGHFEYFLFLEMIMLSV